MKKELELVLSTIYVLVILALSTVIVYITQ